MKIRKHLKTLLLAGFIFAVLAFWGCPQPVAIDDPVIDNPVIDDPVISPTIISKYPEANADGIVVFDNITATFSQDMNPETIVAANFTLVATVSGDSIPGVISYSDKIAIFNPIDSLAENTDYTVSVNAGVKNVNGIAMVSPVLWDFTTGGLIVATSPLAVDLGTAGNYAVLAQSQITNVPTSIITGHIGLSPAAEAGITGFSQTDVYTGEPPTIEYATSDQLAGGGLMYAADMVGGTPNTASVLSTAIDDKLTAYNDAFSRATPDFLNIGGGTISGLIFDTGLYRWDSTVIMTGDITISGSASDIWIFQVVGELTVSSGKKIILTGGALPQNVFWQVSGVVTLGTTVQFEGIILGAEDIRLLTGASLTGRALAKKQVILQQVTITQPVD